MSKQIRLKVGDRVPMPVNYALETTMKRLEQLPDGSVRVIQTAVINADGVVTHVVNEPPDAPAEARS